MTQEQAIRNRSLSTYGCFAIGLFLGAGIVLIYHSYISKELEANRVQVRTLQEEYRDTHRLLNVLKFQFDELAKKSEQKQ